MLNTEEDSVSWPERFFCLRCGKCCQGRGGIWLKAADLPLVAALLDISVEELTLRYLEPQADLWAIKTSEKGYCLMWDGLGCRIHKAKPLMCAAWPYFYGPLTQEEAFKAAQDACPGLKGWVWARLKETCLKWPPKSFYKFLSQKPFKGDQEG